MLTQNNIIKNIFYVLGGLFVIEKAQKVSKFIVSINKNKLCLPVGETEFAPIAANVTRFCIFTEFTTENNYKY